MGFKTLNNKIKIFYGALGEHRTCDPEFRKPICSHIWYLPHALINQSANLTQNIRFKYTPRWPFLTGHN